MKTRLVGIAIMSIAATVFGGEIKVADSDDPILQYFTVTVTRASADQPIPNLKINFPPLLTIRSIRNLIVPTDGKRVTVVLNESEAKKLIELTHKFQGRSFCCQVSEKPFVGAFGLSSDFAPKDDVIEFSGYSGNIAEYLRRRFGK